MKTMQCFVCEKINKTLLCNSDICSAVYNFIEKKRKWEEAFSEDGPNDATDGFSPFSTHIQQLHVILYKASLLELSRLCQTSKEIRDNVCKSQKFMLTYLTIHHGPNFHEMLIELLNAEPYPYVYSFMHWAKFAYFHKAWNPNRNDEQVIQLGATLGIPEIVEWLYPLASTKAKAMVFGIVLDSLINVNQPENAEAQSRLRRAFKFIISTGQYDENKIVIDQLFPRLIELGYLDELDLLLTDERIRTIPVDIRTDWLHVAGEFDNGNVLRLFLSKPAFLEAADYRVLVQAVRFNDAVAVRYALRIIDPTLDNASILRFGVSRAESQEAVLELIKDKRITDAYITTEDNFLVKYAFTKNMTQLLQVLLANSSVVKKLEPKQFERLSKFLKEQKGVGKHLI